MRGGSVGSVWATRLFCMHKTIGIPPCLLVDLCIQDVV
jgi:hypothetical protein